MLQTLFLKGGIMFDGKKEVKDLAIEVSVELNIFRAEADIMLSQVKEYEERRSIERLIDSLERSKDDIRRSTLQTFVNAIIVNEL